MGSSRLGDHKSRSVSCLRSLAPEAPAGPKHSLLEGRTLCPPGTQTCSEGQSWWQASPV